MVRFGLRTFGLELMKHGRTAEEGLRALVSIDEGRAVRQVAMVDAEGNVAAHTGDNAVGAAGHQSGAQYSVQANMMENDDVWPAVAEAYESTDGDIEAAMRSDRQHEQWAVLVPRLPDAGLLEREDLAQRLVDAMTEAP